MRLLLLQAQARARALGQWELCWVCRASWVLSLPQLLQALLLLGHCHCCCCWWGLMALHSHAVSAHALAVQQQQQEERCCLPLLLLLLPPPCVGPWSFLLQLLALLGW